MNEGVKYMVYSLAISMSTMVVCYTEPLRAFDKGILVVSGLIIGWFWTIEVIKQNRRDNRIRRKHNKYRRKSK